MWRHFICVSGPLMWPRTHLCLHCKMTVAITSPHPLIFFKYFLVCLFFVFTSPSSCSGHGEAGAFPNCQQAQSELHTTPHTLSVHHWNTERETRQTTMYVHTHHCRQLRITNHSNTHTFELWEEARGGPDVRPEPEVWAKESQCSTECLLRAFTRLFRGVHLWSDD